MDILIRQLCTIADPSGVRENSISRHAAVQEFEGRGNFSSANDMASLSTRNSELQESVLDSYILRIELMIQEICCDVVRVDHQS